MSTIAVTNVKHPSAVDPAIVLDADGDVTYAGVHDFSAATVTGAPQGLVHIATESFSAVSSVSLNNVFTSAYQSYVVKMEGLASAGAPIINFRLRATGSDITAGNYTKRTASLTSSASVVTWDNIDFGRSQTSSNVGLFSTTDSFLSFDISSPQLEKRTNWFGRSSEVANGNIYISSGGYQATTVADGFTVFPASGTITGTIRVYGYANS